MSVERTLKKIHEDKTPEQKLKLMRAPSHTGIECKKKTRNLFLIAAFYYNYSWLDLNLKIYFHKLMHINN